MIAMFSVAFAAPPPPPLDMKGTDLELRPMTACLPSGLRVLYHHEPDHQAIRWTTQVSVGSTADPVGQEGLAHLVEHLWFDTTTFLKVDDRVVSNATTSPDLTTFYQLASSDDLGDLIEVESQRFSSTLRGVTDDLLEREKRVVEAERRLRLVNASGARLLLPLLFDAPHPYHRSIVGTAESIASLDRAGAMAFWTKHVRPERTSWVITSPQSPQTFLALLEKRGAPDIWRSNADRICTPEPVPAPPFERPDETRIIEVEALTSGPWAQVAWILPPAFGTDQGQFERMVDVVDQTHPRWSCTYVPLQLASVAVCGMPLFDGADAEPLEDQAKAAVSRVSRAWTSSGYSLLMAQNRTARRTATRQLRRFERTTTDHTDAALWHHTGELEGGPLAKETSLVSALLMGVFQSDATAFIDTPALKQWFDPKHATILVVRPRQQQGELATGHVHGPPQVDARVTTATDASPERLDDLFVPLTPDSIRTRTLDNGLTIWVRPFGGAPFAHSRLVLRGARSTAPDLPTHDLLWERLRSSSMSKAAVRIGGQWRSAGGTRTEIGLSSVQSRLTSQLYLLREKIDAHQVYLRGLSDDAAGIEEPLWETLEDPSVWARRSSDVALTGEPDGWTPETLARAAKIRRKDLKTWFRQVFRPQDAVLVIVGDVEPREALDSAEQWFDSWRNRSRDPLTPRRTVRTDVDPFVEIYDDPRRSDAIVRMGCPQFGRATPVATWAAQQLLHDRVSRQLRETWGATYDVSVVRSAISDTAGVWNLKTTVPATLVGPTVREVRRTLAAIAEGDVPSGLLGQLKLTYARKTRFENRGAPIVLERLLGAARHPDGLDSLANERTELGTLSAKTLAEVFESCTEHEFFTVVGPTEAAQASLDEANVPAATVDWRAKLAKRPPPKEGP